MALSHAKLAKKRAKANQKRKGKKYNPQQTFRTLAVSQSTNTAFVEEQNTSKDPVVGTIQL